MQKVKTEIKATKEHLKKLLENIKNLPKKGSKLERPQYLIKVKRCSAEGYEHRIGKKYIMWEGKDHFYKITKKGKSILIKKADVKIIRKVAN